MNSEDKERCTNVLNEQFPPYKYSFESGKSTIKDFLKSGWNISIEKLEEGIYTYKLEIDQRDIDLIEFIYESNVKRNGHDK